MVTYHYTGWTGFSWKIWRLGAAREDSLEAGVSKAHSRVGFVVNGGTADRHAKARREGSDVLVTVGVEVLLRVVDCHPAIDRCIIMPNHISYCRTSIGKRSKYPSYPSCAFGYCGTRL